MQTLFPGGMEYVLIDSSTTKGLSKAGLKEETT